MQQNDNIYQVRSGTYDFALERRLWEQDRALHRLYTNTVFAMQNYLSRYKLIFPEYSDHSELHALTVIDYCNQLIGDQIGQLNADEIYVLLMAVYLHDSGMGITLDHYLEFSQKMDFGNYFDTHPKGPDAYPEIIRYYHHEFSGLFIQKYADFFEIPSPEHLWAIVQVARGHRRTDLMDEAEYPAALAMPNGNTLCMPYLAALIRLADEIDVAAGRNPLLLYDLDTFSDEKQIQINRAILAVKSLQITKPTFFMHIEHTDEQLLGAIHMVAQKMQEVLVYCNKVVRQRTPYVITQKQVAIIQGV